MDGHHQSPAAIEHVLTARGQKMGLYLLIVVVAAGGRLRGVPIDVLVHEVVLQPYRAASPVRYKRWSAHVEDAAATGAGPAQTWCQSYNKSRHKRQQSDRAPETVRAATRSPRKPNQPNRP